MRGIAIASLFAVGCVASSGDDATDWSDDTDTTTEDDTNGDTTNPDDTQPDEPAKPSASGSYDVRSTFDITASALLPEAIYSKVATLRSFSQNPAQTMFDLADQAGVAAVEDIRDALPEYVEDKLEGWINGEIAKLTINGVSVTQHAANIVALAEQSLGKFALDSTLAVDGSTATHALVTLDLSVSLAGLAATFPLSVLPADVITKTATCASDDGTFTIGPHGYAIPYGEYVWQAINAQIDVRATLGAAVNCPALAQTISEKCYWGYCVGHATELTEICERGLDEAVERVHDEFTATKLDLVQLDAGTATIGANGDSMTGTWTAQINAGQGLRSVPATFTATR